MDGAKAFAGLDLTGHRPVNAAPARVTAPAVRKVLLPVQHWIGVGWCGKAGV
ncbi:hypothetical protein GCM10009678_88480 [Actinomadura kijaniata]